MCWIISIVRLLVLLLRLLLLLLFRFHLYEYIGNSISTRCPYTEIFCRYRCFCRCRCYYFLFCLVWFGLIVFCFYFVYSMLFCIRRRRWRRSALFSMFDLLWAIYVSEWISHGIYSITTWVYAVAAAAAATAAVIVVVAVYFCASISL